MDLIDFYVQLALTKDAIISAKKVVFPWCYRKYDAHAFGSPYSPRIESASLLSHDPEEFRESYN